MSIVVYTAVGSRNTQNTAIGAEVVSTAVCAFIRHAFEHFYRDFAMVDTHGKAFQ